MGAMTAEEGVWIWSWPSRLRARKKSAGKAGGRSRDVKSGGVCVSELTTEQCGSHTEEGKTAVRVEVQRGQRERADGEG